MNTKSYKTKLCATGEDCVAIGDYVFSEERDCLYIVLPKADGSFGLDSQGNAALDAVPISRTPSTKPRVWTWNGNEQKPTLSPSILVGGHWHGYLTDGELRSC